jgi:hypothetical protein
MLDLILLSAWYFPRASEGTPDRRDGPAKGHLLDGQSLHLSVNDVVMFCKDTDMVGSTRYLELSCGGVFVSRVEKDTTFTSIETLEYFYAPWEYSVCSPDEGLDVATVDQWHGITVMNRSALFLSPINYTCIEMCEDMNIDSISFTLCGTRWYVLTFRVNLRRTDDHGRCTIYSALPNDKVTSADDRDHLSFDEAVARTCHVIDRDIHYYLVVLSWINLILALGFSLIKIIEQVWRWYKNRRPSTPLDRTLDAPECRREPTLLVLH